MNLIMIKKPIQRRKRRASPPVYVGEWLRAFSLRPTKVAAEAKVNEGYLSEIISGNKKNPSPAFLSDLAKAMPAQPFDYMLFYRKPPDAGTLDAIEGLPASLLTYFRRH